MTFLAWYTGIFIAAAIIGNVANEDTTGFTRILSVALLVPIIVFAVVFIKNFT